MLTPQGVGKVSMQLSNGTLTYPMVPGVEIGDIVIPPQIEAVFPGTDGHPTLKVVIEVMDGIPECTELHLISADSTRGLNGMDLRSLKLEELVDQVVAAASMTITSRDGGVRASVFKAGGAGELGIETLKKARQSQRTNMTRDRLRKVADVYNSKSQAGISAVAAAFQKSDRTAARYIRQAREAGLIP